MAGEVKTERRAYHSPLRADQAQQTRRRVLQSARRLFVDHGYAGTTVAAVADHAGVSPETIYLSLGGKRGLLEGVIETAITGPNNSATNDDQWWNRLAQQSDAYQRLEKLVEFSCQILARTRPIHAIIRGAADKEAFAAASNGACSRERLTAQTERIRRYIGEALRPELSIAMAGERYCALASRAVTPPSPSSSPGQPTNTGNGHPTAANRNCSGTRDPPEMIATMTAEPSQGRGAIDGLRTERPKPTSWSRRLSLRDPGRTMARSSSQLVVTGGRQRTRDQYDTSSQPASGPSTSYRRT